MSSAPPSEIVANASHHVGAGSDHVEASRRERKKRATSQALRAAALSLASERGLGGFTVEDIANAADVSTRTFFNYFPSKEAAVVGYDPDRTELLGRALLARPATDSPLEALRRVLVAELGELATEVVEFHDGRAESLRRLAAVKADPNLRPAYLENMAQLEAVLVDALSLRLGADAESDPYPALVVATTLSAVRTALMYWATSGGESSLVDAANAAIDTLAIGLSSEGVAVPGRDEQTSSEVWDTMIRERRQ